jgi:hypothetical protein
MALEKETIEHQQRFNPPTNYDSRDKQVDPLQTINSQRMGMEPSI